MKEVTVGCGNIESCLNELKEIANECGEVCSSKFNDKYLLSTDTLDEAYLRIVGKTKAQMDEARRKWMEEYNKREAEFKKRIPRLIDTYRKKARGLILEEMLEKWDEVVPIRLNDLYHGMELDEVLESCRIMRDESVGYDKRLRKAYDRFMDSGHSGASAYLTASMLRAFCPNGDDLSDAVLNFRFERK